ncbi:MAG: hypothetical protein ABI386_12860 [Rhodanobacter sp.]
MNEFEWRRQLRNLRQPRVPDRDLWTAIDATLDGLLVAHATDSRARPLRRRRWLLGVGLAASMVLACGLGWRMLQTQAARTGTTVTSTWRPADPRLAGAAIELDAARVELELAMRQAPNSAALQRLLHRTEQQQAQLRQLTARAS